jgi:hypothetical protein
MGFYRFRPIVFFVVGFLPAPKIRKGKWSKERERTKSGRWRKKRSDADMPRKSKHPLVKWGIAVVGILVLVLVITYFAFPDLLRSIGLKLNG